MWLVSSRAGVVLRQPAVALLDSSRDGVLLLAMVFTFGAVSLLVAFLPARYAAEVDPPECWRSE